MTSSTTATPTPPPPTPPTAATETPAVGQAHQSSSSSWWLNLRRVLCASDYMSRTARHVASLDGTQNLYTHTATSDPHECPAVLVENPVQVLPFVHSLVAVMIFPFSGIIGILAAQLLVAFGHGFLYALGGSSGLGWESTVVGTIAALGGAFGGVCRVFVAHAFMSGWEDSFAMVGMWWMLALSGACASAVVGTHGVAMGINRGYAMQKMRPPGLTSVDIIGECWSFLEDIWYAPPVPARVDNTVR